MLRTIRLGWSILFAVAALAGPAAAMQGQDAPLTAEEYAELGRSLGMSQEDIDALDLSPAELRDLLDRFTEEVTVGSRAQPRSATESAVPVDVIPTSEFLSQGATDLTNQLRTVVPSFNVATQPISDAATIVRPVNLRNLAPDHPLILVNGKRRHRAAVITWLGNGVADGSQGPDISVIPAIALRQVEVLRDGASAQYGSDAIAGVMNFQLKDAASGGSMEFRTGFHGDANVGQSPPGHPDLRPGIWDYAGSRAPSYTFAGNVGLPLGGTGFANLSLEYGGAAPTSRSEQRNDALRIIGGGNADVRDPAQIWGSPLTEDDLKLFGNFGHLFDNGLQWYAHTNYARRKVTGGFYFRNPHNRGGVFGYYDELGGVPNSFDAGIDQRYLLVGDRAWAATGVEGPRHALCLLPEASHW